MNNNSLVHKNKSLADTYENMNLKEDVNNFDAKYFYPKLFEEK